MSTFKLSSIGYALLAVGLISTTSANAAGVSLNTTVATPGTFTQDFSFTVANGFFANFLGNLSSSFDIGVVTSGPTAGSAFVSGINLTSITLNGSSFAINGTDVVNSFAATSSTPAFVLTSTNEISLLSALNLSAGNYTLSVNGVAFSPNATFLGSYSLNVSPVPETSTMSLLVAGLSLVGFLGFRRKTAI